MESWQPTADINSLKRRSQILRNIREFFFAKNIMEVETPILAKNTVTDPYIDSFKVNYQNTTCFLQTSPEYAMKRLLAAGSGDIYQLTKSFRLEEQGSIHNPEFTMLEWYREGIDHMQLITEVDELLQHTLNTKPATKISYTKCWQQHLSINPSNCSIEELKILTGKHIPSFENQNLTHNEYLDLLFTHIIEPTLGFNSPVFIYDYPASQASLAKITTNNGEQVACRFELYIEGTELANGFYELQDAAEQMNRFLQDNKIRKQLNKDTITIDHQLIAALSGGLPNCSGVALGIDRLVMLACKKEKLSDVMSFAWS